MSLVTIILTTLNSERFLARSIESCLQQTHRDIELLVVDGGSRDQTLPIVESYGDARIRIIHQVDNAGNLPGALNLGMSHAHGDFITWTQDDCWYRLDAIQIMMKHLATRPEIAFVYTDFYEVDPAGDVLQYHAVEDPERLIEGDVVGACFLFRRSVYETIGPMDVKYFPVQELPWRLKVARYFKMEPLHIPLMHYIVRKGSLTGRYGHWDLEREAASAVLAEGYINRSEYNFRLAQIDIHQAYEEYILQANYAAFRRFALAGIRRSPRWLTNVGLWKLFVSSLLPLRTQYRANLFAAWQTAEAARDRQLRLAHDANV